MDDLDIIIPAVERLEAENRILKTGLDNCVANAKRLKAERDEARRVARRLLDDPAYRLRCEFKRPIKRTGGFERAKGIFNPAKGKIVNKGFTNRGDFDVPD